MIVGERMQAALGPHQWELAPRTNTIHKYAAAEMSHDSFVVGALGSMLLEADRGIL